MRDNSLKQSAAWIVKDSTWSSIYNIIHVSTSIDIKEFIFTHVFKDIDRTVDFYVLCNVWDYIEPIVLNRDK